MDPVVAPVVQGVTEGVISRLLDSICRRIGYLTKLNENAESLTNKMSVLKALKEDIDRRVDVSERQGLEPRNIVKVWLHEVESVQLIVHEIDADSQQRKRCLQECYLDCSSSRYRLGKKTVKTIAKVSDLITRGKEFDSNVADIGLPVPVETIPSTSVVGANPVIMQVLDYLKQEEVMIMGLYGMGGIGKTTILNKINNMFEGTEDFNVVISVAVNKDANTREIQKAIYERLRMPWSEDESPERRAINMHKTLCKLKYLLLLDNMWDNLDLVKVIGVPEPTTQNKRKVVFTTRNEEVCDSMGAQIKIKIDVLGEADAWNLFQEKVGDWVLDCPPPMLSIAKEVAEMCGGLPLALATVGQAMVGKKTLPEWRNAKRALSKASLEIKGMENVLSILQYSYDCLQDNATKLCFLYCSFFPESRDIYIEDVKRYWIGEGYFDGIESYTEAYDKACDVLANLKKACLLESGVVENIVKMHDVVREMALGVAFGKKGKFIREESSVDDEWNEAEMVFLIGERLRVLPESPECPNLSTLILEDSYYLKNVPEMFFQNMHNLRVVNFSRMNILSLPQSLSLLENLRYLNLSYTQIRELPIEIGRLIKLQHLDLSQMELESLPQEFGGLHSLEHLNLRGTHSLQTIPHTTISKLSQLKELNLIDGFRNWELKEQGDDGIGVKLEELESLKHLRTLGINIENDHIFQRLFQSPFLLKCVELLKITNLEVLSLKPMLSGFAKMGVLRKLYIHSCERLEEFIIGSEVEEDFLGSLEVLDLDNLPNLNNIWEGTMPQGCLGNLRSLEIFKCHKLKSLRWVHNLPCLNNLSLSICDEMEEILRDDELMEDIIFPKLQTLYLRNLPKLVSFYHRMLVFPSLESLSVEGCPQLKKLPFGAHSARKLRAIYGKREWWEALEWEDEETNMALLPLYQQ